MTIVIGPTKAAALATAGTSNNPIIAWKNIASESGTASTTGGTEVEAAALALTGTTYDAWVATPTGSAVELAINFSSAQSISFAGIAAHNIGTLGASVRIQYSTNGGGTWSDSGAGVVNPTDDQAIGFYFDAVSAADWRVRIENYSASDDVEIAVAFFGNPLTVEQRIYQGYRPPITPTNVALQSNVSEGGNLLGSAIVRKGSSAQASFTHLTPAFIRDTSANGWKAFQSHFNAGKGFMWAWRPSKYGDLHWAWRDGDPIAPANSGPQDYMSADISFRMYDQP